MVMCEILEDGEKALFYKYDGKVTLKEGPKRIYLIRSSLKRLQRFTAKHDEYLKITFKSGIIKHTIGPCNEYLNHLIHSSITVENCYCMNANEAIIVYKKKAGEDDKFARRIEYGPTIYMIEPDEWLHCFTWHGASDDDKTSYVPGNNRFEILNFAPNQLYYNVKESRTADDALIKIKLMIFYELKDIEKMLDATKDPIADFINCCSSDVTKFVSTKSYLNFIENCYMLNDISNYTKLVERAKLLGFEVTKVVFRGYLAAPKLQLIHDKSMETRTQLKLEHESALQENDRKYTDLQNKIKRLTSEQNLELEKLKNSQELEKIKIDNMLDLKLNQLKNETEINKEMEIKKLENLSTENQSRLEYLKILKNHGVDPTEYLTSSMPQTEKLIQITKKYTQENASSGEFPNIHFHE